MIGQISVASFLTIAIFQIAFALPPNSHMIGKQDNRFEVIVDGKKLVYEIGVIGIDFTPDKLTVNRNKEPDSAQIALSEGYTMLINGDFVDHADRKKYPEYAFVKNQYLNVKAAGSAKLAADGKHVENCKFEWARTTPIYENELKDAVVNALLENLEEIVGKQLCHEVNVDVDKFSL